MTFGFVEIHTSTSCNAAGINMSNTVQYSMCYGSNIYVLVFEHILWLHELNFYVPSNKKDKVHYWTEMGYIFMPTSSEKVLMWISYYTKQEVDINIYVCFSLNYLPWSQKCTFVRVWTYFVTLPPTYSTSNLFTQKIFPHNPCQHLHNSLTCNKLTLTLVLATV